MFQFADKQVFSDLDFLGWYTTGEAPTDQDIKVHKQICLINECPIMLQLNPQPRNTDVCGWQPKQLVHENTLTFPPIQYAAQKLPVSLYESLIDLVHGEPQMLFVPLTYTLATEEAERIGVDHVVRMSNSEVGDRSVGEWNRAIWWIAVSITHVISNPNLFARSCGESGRPVQCHKDVALARAARAGLHSWRRGRQAGAEPWDYARSVRANVAIARRRWHGIPRRIFYGKWSALSDGCGCWCSGFYTRGWYSQQSNDVGLITYLGILTKGCNMMNNLVNKFNVLYDRQGMSRRMRGIFF